VLTIVLIAVGAWAALAWSGLSHSLVYSYTPAEVAAGKTPPGDIRVGGQVAPGSVRWDARQQVLRFVLRDGRARLPVLEHGAPPSLFRAGNGAVVEGELKAGVLVSSSVIVRHGSSYRPPAEPAATR
jgi:cytochrome c-type biogenesis protein CcmE